jgi:hypothetical protein
MMLNGERHLALLYSTASRFSTFKVTGTPFADGSCDGQKAPLGKTGLERNCPPKLSQPHNLKARIGVFFLALPFIIMTDKRTTDSTGVL